MGHIPEASQVASQVQLMLEDDRADSSAQPMPEANRAASPVQQMPENDRGASTDEFMPEAYQATSQESSLPCDCGEDVVACFSSPKELTLVHCTGGYTTFGPH